MPNVMCQICFDATDVDTGLFVDAEGSKWDICKPCGDRETAMGRKGDDGAPAPSIPVYLDYELITMDRATELEEAGTHFAVLSGNNSGPYLEMRAKNG